MMKRPGLNINQRICVTGQPVGRFGDARRVLAVPLGLTAYW
jgi:hypothetical protein